MLFELISSLLLFKLREKPTVITGIKYQMAKFKLTIHLLSGRQWGIFFNDKLFRNATLTC